MYHQEYYAIKRNDPAKFGFVSAIINAAAAIIPGLGGLFGGGSIPGQAKGLAAITSATSQIINSMEALRAQVGQGNYQQILADAQRLNYLLSDHATIYQAQKGKDAAVLQQAKQRAAQILQEIAAAGAQVSPTGTVINQAGQVVAAGGTFTQGILQDRTLLYAGIGLAALYIYASAQKK